MIAPEWKRIAGMYVEDDGDIGMVWLAHDKDSDKIHLYDACIFRREVLAVIAESINARGRWVPVAWESASKELADKLLERGCNMLPDPVKETQAVAEVSSRDILERMRGHRFKVDKRVGEWLEEYKSFHRNESQVPKQGYPLMSATRFGISMLEYARRQSTRRKSTNYPKVATV